ncbi:MAG: hypothetical protein K2L70_06735 [Clostridia bacterium]|nr:hypothetical protein [Clostridia bacterium]
MSKEIDESKGRWRTICGRKVFIKKGQSVSEAMRTSGKFSKEDINNATKSPQEKSKTASCRVRVEEKVQRVNEDKDTVAKSKDENVEKKMTPTEKIASVHIDFDNDNILPKLDENSLKIMGVEKSKPVLLKKSTIDRNFQEHDDLTKEDFQSIIAQALYEPSEVFPANAEKPYWHFAKVIKETSKGHSKIGLALLDIDINKENFEVAHAHFVGAKGLARAKNKIKKKD